MTDERRAGSAKEIRVFEDAGELAAGAALAVESSLEQAVAARDFACLALAGGSTPQALYRRLAERSRPDQLWKSVEIFWGDERAVPPDHRDSNFSSARSALLDGLAEEPRAVHRIEAELDPRVAADRYETVLGDLARRQRTPDGVPRFDLILLGLGADGHIASLFPGSTGLLDEERSVVAHQVRPAGEKREVWRITMTFPVLLAARRVLVLVSGRDKAAAVAATLNPGAPAGDTAIASSATPPARRLLARTEATAWFLDRAAASLLGTSPC